MSVSSHGRPPRASVIMRTKNSGWVVGQALAGLFNQGYHDFELIVADCGSTDETRAIVADYPCRLIEIEPGSYFPGAVLNRVAAEARGELLVFQNSDVVPLGPDCLARLLAPFDDPQVQATYARQLPRPEALGWVRRDYAASFPDGAAPEWITLSLPLAAIRRAAWAERPFYTDAWASEDTEWGHWAREAGLEIRYVPSARVMHSHNYTHRELYGRKFVEGEADAFIYGNNVGWREMLQRTCRAAAADIAWLAAAGRLTELPAAPLRRLIGQWAWYRGHQLGAERRDVGDRDASQGQQLVLERHVR